MADVKACDRCGKSPAHRAEVSVAIWNIAEVDQPTATILGADTCASCQEATVDTLHKHAVEMLREQAPLHKKAIELRDRRDRAENAMRSIRPALDAARAAAERNPDTVIDKQMVAREGELLEEIAAAESERLDVITQGTKSSDAIVSKMRKALKAKK